MSRSEFEFALAGVAVGDFAGDERADVAVLSTDGMVQVLTRAGGDDRTASKTDGEKAGDAQAAQGLEAAGAVEWQRSEPASVRGAEGVSEASGAPGLLMRAKVSSLSKDDLLVLGGGRAHVITNEAAKAVERRVRGKVATDQLDTSKFDLSTFQLGPVSFGKDKFVVPPAGLSQWTTDVDLRPANNLVVRINAGLNPQTGVVRWAFISLDPATMQPTEDPLAGFLPPNKTAPEGEGSVLFNVSTKAGVQTGDEVRNGARIVFDVNAPIDTPVWLNTIDNSPPASDLKQLAAAQPYVVFYVNWSGSDTGSGLWDYSVFVSEDGGPYNIWLSETTNTSGIFVGRPGKTYTFYSVARDRAGNVEAVKTSPGATTTTPNVVTNVVDAPRFFALQHYRDFLGRDPDPSGFDFWTKEIAACGGDAGCVDFKRTNVSQAFFLSIEFQQTGYLAYRFYRATFADSSQRPRGLPRMAELLAAARTLGEGVGGGAAGWEQRLEQNKQAAAREWVERPEVLAELPGGMTAAQFVDKLFATSGVVPTAAERDAALAAFGAGGTDGRAAARRSVAESGSVYNKQYNPAFVLMQYAGYLRRNPNDAPDTDYTGYDFWLAKMDEFSAPGEDVRDPLTAQRRIQRAEMVRAFIVSDEYRKRFGQ